MKNIDPDEVQPDDKLIQFGSRALVLRRRTEPLNPEHTAAVSNLKAEVARVLLPAVGATDRVLRKWPWLYRRLGGDRGGEGVSTALDTCPACWGSHGCSLPDGHDGHHDCGCCECEDHPDPDSGCVGKFPFYGTETRFTHVRTGELLP